MHDAATQSGSMWLSAGFVVGTIGLLLAIVHYVARSPESMKGSSIGRPMPRRDYKSYALSPDNSADYFYDLGQRYERIEEYLSASGYYLRALRLKPNWPEVRYRLGLVYVRMRQEPEALEQLEILNTLHSELAEDLSAHISQRPKRM